MKTNPLISKNSKLISKTSLCLVAAFAMFGALPGAFGAVLIESFESGTLNGWNATTLNGSTGTVNTDRASDGTFSYGNTFTVPASFAPNYNFNDILSKDPRLFLDPATTTLSMDVYSDWANANGWGLYSNQIKLELNYQGGYTTVAATSGSLANGSFQTLTFDLSPYAATITNPGLSYSSVGIAWELGVYSDNGNPVNNGTQTFAVDNIQAVVPEPATSAMLVLGSFVMFALLRRRRSSLQV